MSASTETARVLSTIFIDRAVEAAGMATGILTVASMWLFLGQRFTAFDLNRRSRI